MAEDMEMFLEQVIKKTNPEEYIKILEQDREDFAEEINRLNNIIDKAIIYMQNYINTEDSMMCESAREEFKEIINILHGKEK